MITPLDKFEQQTLDRMKQQLTRGTKLRVCGPSMPDIEVVVIKADYTDSRDPRTFFIQVHTKGGREVDLHLTEVHDLKWGWVIIR